MVNENAWEFFLTGQDRVIFEAVGGCAPLPTPKRPALIVSDVTLDFFGPTEMTAIDAVAVNTMACGPRAWVTVPAISALLKTARTSDAPVVYVRHSEARLAEDRSRSGQSDEARGNGNMILPELAPAASDLVLGADKPSAFWKTRLEAHLEAQGVDALVLVGGRMSSCVRATAFDGFNRDYGVFIVPEAVFDQFEASQALALFDCHRTCAELLTLAAATQILSVSG